MTRVELAAHLGKRDNMPTESNDYRLLHGKNIQVNEEITLSSKTYLRQIGNRLELDRYRYPGCAYSHNVKQVACPNPEKLNSIQDTALAFSLFLLFVEESSLSLIDSNRLNFS